MFFLGTYSINPYLRLLDASMCQGAATQNLRSKRQLYLALAGSKGRAAYYLLSYCVSAMTHKTKWLLLAPAGLLTVGAGACLISWASALKEKGAPPAKWVGAGTVALAVFNAGLSLFGRGVSESVLYELKEKPAAQ